MKIHTIGGFNEVGKNMSVIELKDDAIMLDSGFHLPSVIELQEQENGQAYTESKLRRTGAIANDTILDKMGVREKVRAILLGHAHLDHVGAVPYMAYRYKAPVVGTRFTTAVLKHLIDDEKISISNKIVSMQPNEKFLIRGKKRNYEAEFINMTHSTPQTAMLAIHTPEGVVAYANDFKLDNNPVLGAPPNYSAIKRIAKEGVKAVIIDALYSGSETKTPSEKVARALLEEVLLTIQNKNSAIFVPTFSSHIARLKSIVDFGEKMGRNIYFLGRSLNKYVSAAKDAGISPFKKKVTLVRYSKQVQRVLHKIEKERAKSLIVCTGHQGEPGSILERISRKALPFEFKKNDNIVFSSKTIPVPINIANKEKMDKNLKKAGARIFDNAHVSGHGGKEDLRDLISLLNPEHIIPSHGATSQLTPTVELAREMGYRSGKECHLMQNQQTLEL
jgi:ribonuclease J